MGLMNGCFCGLCSHQAPSLCEVVEAVVVPTETKNNAVRTIEATIPEEIATRRFNKQAVVFFLPRVALNMN